MRVVTRGMYFTKRASFNFYAKTVSLHATRFFFIIPRAVTSSSFCIILYNSRTRTIERDRASLERKDN